MFTGLVEQIGVLQGVSGAKLRLKCALPADLRRGESIAVNGVCLTLENWRNDGGMTFHTLEETLKRSNLGRLPVGAKLNMERALAADGRFGGHIVSGHVDAVGRLLELRRVASGDFLLKVELPELLAGEVVSKGSIAVDGVSLTVIDVGDGFFTVELIPTTLDDTALLSRRAGDWLNLESDILAKYAAARDEVKRASSSLTMEKLREAGFLD